jgi:glycosyltransferase involved in cell wall biosynthesis
VTNAALVLITTSFPIVSDGSEAAGSFVSDLAEEIAKHVPVRVVAPGPSSAREQWSPGVEVFRYAAPAKPLSTLKPWRPSDLTSITQVWRAGARATRDAVLAGPAAHMLALWALPSGEWARRASKVTGVPYSVWTLGSDIWTLGRFPLVRRLLRRVLYDAHKCYSDGMKLAEDTRRLAARAVTFLPSTRRIDSENIRQPAPHSPYRLLFIGRWHPNKGVDLLLDALDLLNDEDWASIDCVEIQGGGPLDTLVRERVATLRECRRPVLAGSFLDKAEAEAAIHSADWVLIPSRIESIPIVFSDAMKLGRPVISMPVGDLPRLVSTARCGILASEVSAPMFCEAIRTALTHSPSSFKAAIRDQAILFNLSAVASVLTQEMARSD